MAESGMRRAAQALRDPWSLLAAAVGVGAAWALALPIAGIGAVGVGMLGVAATVGAISGRSEHSPDVPDRELVADTVQFRLVETLQTYLADLTKLRSGPLSPVMAAQTTDGLEAAQSARSVSIGVARSVDALDNAIGQAGQVASRMTAAEKVAGPLDRMLARRQELLGKLTSAVDGVGELYTKLLELAAAPELTGGVPGGLSSDPVAEVNDSLDAIRGAFAELEASARTTAAGLGPRAWQSGEAGHTQAS